MCGFNFNGNEIKVGVMKNWTKARLDKELKQLKDAVRDAGDINDSMIFDIVDEWLIDNTIAEVAIKNYYNASDVPGFVVNRIV